MLAARGVSVYTSRLMVWLGGRVQRSSARGGGAVTAVATRGRCRGWMADGVVGGVAMMMVLLLLLLLLLVLLERLLGGVKRREVVALWGGC